LRLLLRGLTPQVTEGYAGHVVLQIAYLSAGEALRLFSYLEEADLAPSWAIGVARGEKS